MCVASHKYVHVETPLQQCKRTLATPWHYLCMQEGLVGLSHNATVSGHDVLTRVYTWCPWHRPTLKLPICNICTETFPSLCSWPICTLHTAKQTAAAVCHLFIRVLVRFVEVSSDHVQICAYTFQIVIRLLQGKHSLAERRTATQALVLAVVRASPAADTPLCRDCPG